MTIKRLTGIAAVASLMGAAPRANAGQWQDYSGANMAQVVVAGNLAFATTVGGFNASTGQFPEYGQNMAAFTSAQGATQVGACIGPAFSGSAYGLFSGNNHIESMAATARYMEDNRPAPSGYFEIWVMATNGNTYRTWGNSACATSPDSSNVPVPWQLVAGVNQYPRGASLSPARISIAHIPAAQLIDHMEAHMVDYYNNLWNLRVFFPPSGVWTTPQNNSTDATMFDFGDSSDGTVHRAVGTTNLYAFCAACNADAPVPSLPPGVDLALTSRNFYKVGFTQPVTHNASTIWAVTTAGSASNNQNIMQSTLSGGAWSAWQTYPTGQLPQPNDPLAWSIVDASSYRGIAGNIFVIGQAYHLLEYVP